MEMYYSLGNLNNISHIHQEGGFIVEKADCNECRFKRTIHIDSSTCCVNRAAEVKSLPGAENNGFYGHSATIRNTLWAALALFPGCKTRVNALAPFVGTVFLQGSRGFSPTVQHLNCPCTSRGLYFFSHLGPFTSSLYGEGSTAHPH